MIEEQSLIFHFYKHLYVINPDIVENESQAKRIRHPRKIEAALSFVPEWIWLLCKGLMKFQYLKSVMGFNKRVD